MHLDDTRDPATRRVGESLYTSGELLAAEKVLLDAAQAPARGLANPRVREVLISRVQPYLEGLAPDQAAAVPATATLIR